ncbi:MAG TPA: patatin-like phospholipase family protein [Candidatus Binatia bacterium]
MARRKRVFILGGGAALGAHQVGALKYLEEQGIKPDVIVASSIGVINASVYATGGVPALEEAWSTFRSLPLIVTPSLRHNPVFGHSLFSADRLQRAIEEHVDFPKIFDSHLGLEFILLNLSRGLGEMHGKDDCADWRELRTVMRAGYAIPFLFPPVRFRGEWYADGGFAWNVPLDYALSLKPSEIYVLAPIASELPYKARFHSFYDFAWRVADVLWRTIGNMGYIYAPIVDGKVNGVPVTVIEPGEQWSGFGPLAVFQAYPRKNRNLMEAGYRDAKRTIALRRRAEERARSRTGRKTEPATTEAEVPPNALPEPPIAVPTSAKIVSIGRRHR